MDKELSGFTSPQSSMNTMVKNAIPKFEPAASRTFLPPAPEPSDYHLKMPSALQDGESDVRKSRFKVAGKGVRKLKKSRMNRTDSVASSI